MTLKAALAFTVVLSFLICLQAGCTTRPPAASELQPLHGSSELQRLQGYWEGDGAAGPCSITITGNSLHFYARKDFWFQTTFALPAGTDPKQLHATIKKSASSSTNDIGEVVFAIYKIEDETLTLAVEGNEPPKSFGGNAALYIVKKVSLGVPKQRQLKSRKRLTTRQRTPIHLRASLRSRSNRCAIWELSFGLLADHSVKPLVEGNCFSVSDTR